MHTPTPAARRTPDRCGRPRKRQFTWPRILDATPIMVVTVYGALWIATQAQGGRGPAHTLWQSLALAEAVLALLLRWRKPLTSLAGILAMYLLTDLAALTLLPVLFALLTVAAIRDHRAVVFATAATATVMAATPYIHGDAVSLPGYTLPRLAAAGVAVAAGLWLRAARTRADAQPGQAQTGRPEQ